MDSDSLVQILFLVKTRQKAVVKIKNTQFCSKPQYMVKYSPKTLVFRLYFVGQYYCPIKLVHPTRFELATLRIGI